MLSTLHQEKRKKLKKNSIHFLIAVKIAAKKHKEGVSHRKREKRRGEEAKKRRNEEEFSHKKTKRRG